MPSEEGLDSVPGEKIVPAPSHLEEAEAPSPRSIQGARWILVVLAVLSSTFFHGLDNTVVADIQPAVINQFDAIDRLPWVSITFLIGAASTNFFCTGQVYSNFNIKWSYVSCVATFEVGSAICGAAPSMSAFLVGRTICGLGGSGMYTGVMTILSCLTSPAERPAYLGLTGFTWGLGTVLGPIIGGAFTVSSATWRWSLYINLVFGAVCAPIYVFLVPSIEGFGSGSFRSRVLKLDWIGSTLIAGLLISFLMAISFGGVVYAWSSATIIALFVLSGVLLIIFALQQVYCIGTTETSRVFPLQFLKNRELILLFAAEVCATTLTFIPIYFTPLFFQFARSDTALQAGVSVLPLVMFLVAMIVASGLFTARYPWYKPWFLVGSIFALVGAACLYTVDSSTSDAKIYGYSIMLGFGAGCFVTLVFAAAQTHVDHESIPLAVGFICFAQLAGSAITLGIANSVFLNEATQAVVHILPSLSAANAQRIISGVGTNIVTSLSATDRQRINDVIITSLNKAYIITIACGALAVILSLLLTEKAREKKPSTLIEKIKSWRAKSRTAPRRLEYSQTD